MINRTLKQVAEMCGGNSKGVDPGLTIHGVVTDSRNAKPGQLFIPLIGERFDGHHYAEQAIAGGAVAMLWQADHEVPSELQHVPRVLVKNTLAALQQLAKAYRSELVVRVVGITGSNGKTTTKDLTAAVLGTVYKVHKTEGNLNNEIGLPLTVLQLEEDTEVAVLEMGMSGFGEIELLTQIAQPDAAIITNIGESHMLQLGSRAGIAKAKLEITSGLSEQGLLLFNGDEPLLHEEIARTAIPSGVTVRTFGLSDRNEWSAEQIKLYTEGSSFIAKYNGEASSLGELQLKTPGIHNISNALGVIAVARFFGVPAHKIAEGLLQANLTGMRIEPSTAFNGAKLLNDCYNASPTSVRAALDLVASVEGYSHKWIVLGDMLELGEEEAQMHEEIGKHAALGGATAVLAYGELSRHIYEGAKAVMEQTGKGEAHYFDTKDELSKWLIGRIQEDDIVLVKGSRGMQMEQIVSQLEKG